MIDEIRLGLYTIISVMSNNESIYKRENLTEEELKQLPGRANINNRVTYEYWNRRYGITIDQILENTNISYEDYLNPSLWTNILDVYTSDLNFYKNSNGVIFPRDSYSAGLEMRFVNAPVVVGFFRLLPVRTTLKGIVRENHKFNREYMIESEKKGKNHFLLYYCFYPYKKQYSVGQECHFINGVLDSNYLLHQIKDYLTQHLCCSQSIQNVLHSLSVQNLITWKEHNGEIRVDGTLIAVQMPFHQALGKNGTFDSIPDSKGEKETSVYYVIESLLIHNRVAFHKGEIYNAPYCVIDTSWKEENTGASSLFKSLGYFFHSLFGSNRIADRALQERESAALQALESKTAALEIAKKSEESRKKLLLRLGHELRNPLHGTINLINLAKDRRGSAECEHYLSLATHTVERLSRLVNTILESSNEESDVELNNPSSFNIVPIIQSVLDHYALISDNKNLGYFIESKQKEVWVYGEEDKVSQILFNLLGNAEKHTSKGRITVGVEVKEDVLIVVRDTGRGIEKEDLERVFDPYFQIDNYEEGLGIGLSVVRMLVQAHNGHVWIDSEPNKGTSVFFTLQKGQEVNNLITPTESDEKRINSIWYVEDEVTNRIVLQKSIEKFCFDVRGFSTAQECLKSIETSHPDILIVDLMMPDMDGFALIEKVRERWDQKTLPICVLSARGSQEDIQRAMEKGADEYLGKPIMPFDLEIRLKRVLKEKENNVYGVLIKERAKEAGLSERETECVSLVCHGASNQEIAEALDISESTVKRHLYNIYNKVGCSRRTELIRFFIG